MKKILILSLAYYPQVGGAEVAIKEITDRIYDIEFHMVTLRFSPHHASEEKIGNVLVHRVGQGSGYFSKILFVVRAARHARRLHKKEKFDGAWAMMSYMVLPLVLARLGISYALTLQEGDTERHMFGRLRILPFLPLLRRGFRNARVVSTLSTFLAEWAARMGYRGEVEIIPQGTDIQKFSLPPRPHTGIVLVTSSRLVYKNALDDVIRALPEVPKARFVIAGAGPDEQALRTLVRELGIETRVQFLGQVSNDRLPQLFQTADIFIRPSRSEGFGISFVEAMAARLPVIATQEGGLKDYITPDVAWSVEKDRPDQIALQIKAILGNPERTKQVIKNARSMVEQKYDWSLIARVMLEKVFDKVLQM